MFDWALPFGLFPLLFVSCALVVGLFTLVPQRLPMPGLWAGCGLILLSPGYGRGCYVVGCMLACMWGLVMGIFFARDVGVSMLGWVCMLACMWGLVLVCISSAWDVGLVYLVGLPVGI